MEGRTEVADERDIEEGDVEGAVEGIAQEEETNLTGDDMSDQYVGKAQPTHETLHPHTVPRLWLDRRRHRGRSGVLFVGVEV